MCREDAADDCDAVASIFRARYPVAHRPRSSLVKDIRKRVVMIVAEVLEIDFAEAQTVTMLANRSWNSLATVTIIAAVEDEFGITVPAEDYGLMVSGDGIIEVVGGLTG